MLVVGREKRGLNELGGKVALEVLQLESLLP